MKVELSLNLRAFHVLIRDERTSEERGDVIVFEKQQLKAAEDLSLTPEDLIYRHYNALGYWVLDIHKARKQTVALNLEELYKAQGQTGKREEMRV